MPNSTHSRRARQTAVLAVPLPAGQFDSDFRSCRTVRQRETDASGFVHFANYLCYMEETEYAFLRACGLRVVLKDERGVIGFPRTSTHFEMHTPLRRGDEIEIRLKVHENDGVQLDYGFEITCHSQLVATGRYKAACCRFLRGQLPKAILIPDFVRERLASGPRRD